MRFAFAVGSGRSATSAGPESTTTALDVGQKHPGEQPRGRCSPWEGQGGRNHPRIISRISELFFSRSAENLRYGAPVPGSWPYVRGGCVKRRIILFGLIANKHKGNTGMPPWSLSCAARLHALHICCPICMRPPEPSFASCRTAVGLQYHFPAFSGSQPARIASGVERRNGHAPGSGACCADEP